MTCCGLPTLDLLVPHFADFRRTITPQSGFSFNGFSAHMQVRAEAGDLTVLLDVSMTQTGNGSLFQIVGTSLVLTIRKADISPLNATVLCYDIVVEDQSGVESYLFGGSFEVVEGVTQ